MTAQQLRECGLLSSRDEPEALCSPSGQWRYSHSAVSALHARLQVKPPGDGEEHAVHLWHLQFDADGEAHQRPHAG